MKDLLYGLMLRSGNDAALAIANYVGGNVDDFVLMMNEKAKEIGMKNSTFNNPKIKVYINQKNYDLNDEKILVIDYNKTNYKVLKGE